MEEVLYKSVGRLQHCYLVFSYVEVTGSNPVGGANSINNFKTIKNSYKIV